MARYPKAMARLIEELVRLPGVGPKTAQRLAFFLINQTSAEVQSLTESIVQAKERITYCSRCFHLTEDDPCAICSDSKRNKAFICVVEEPRMLLPWSVPRALTALPRFAWLHFSVGGNWSQ